MFKVDFIREVSSIVKAKEECDIEKEEKPKKKGGRRKKKKEEVEVSE